MTGHLTPAGILAIHEDQIARHGAAAGIRDPGQLEPAPFRPRTGYHADLAGEAAALRESLSQNQPFINGNKRTAFAAMYAFLSIDGVETNADADAIWTFTSRLCDEGRFHFDELEPWLRSTTRVL